MCSVNENFKLIRLLDFMESSEGWGRDQGRKVYQKLIQFVEANPGVMIFKISMNGIKRVDISFASETIVEIARRFRGGKGFCFFDLKDPDILENLDAAASRKVQPIMVWEGKKGRVLGIRPSQGNLGAFNFALGRHRTKATQFVEVSKGMTIPNASTKFNQLWQQGYLLRRQDVAETGGKEFVYYRIG